jgi:hypothetical protein
VVLYASSFLGDSVVEIASLLAYSWVEQCQDISNCQSSPPVSTTARSEEKSDELEAGRLE